jgi:hypothetical protein
LFVVILFVVAYTTVIKTRPLRNKVDNSDCGSESLHNSDRKAENFRDLNVLRQCPLVLLVKAEFGR